MEEFVKVVKEFKILMEKEFIDSFNKKKIHNVNYQQFQKYSVT